MSTATQTRDCSDTRLPSGEADGKDTAGGGDVSRAPADAWSSGGALCGDHCALALADGAGTGQGTTRAYSAPCRSGSAGLVV